MSKTLLLAIAAAVAIVGFLTYRAFEDPTLITPNFNQLETGSSTAANPALAEPNFQLWHEFKSPAEQFKVLLPTLPQHATDKIVDPKTKEPLQYDMFVSEEENGTLYMISIITMMEGTETTIDENLLTTVMNDMLASTPEGKLKKMKMGKHKDHSSIDFSIENGQVIIDGKAFLVDQTLFALTSVAKKEAYQKQKFDFFVNSFQLETPLVK